MADITENTRVAIKVGSIFGALLIVFLVGAWYGDLRSDRASAEAAKLAQGKIDDRQDASIAQLQKTVSDMNTTLALIKQAQDNQLPQLIRQSSYATEVLRDIEVALAAKGILTKEHGP